MRLNIETFGEGEDLVETLLNPCVVCHKEHSLLITNIKNITQTKKKYFISCYICGSKFSTVERVNIAN